MTYAIAAALQAAVYQHLAAAPGLAGVALHDALPPGTVPATYITLGPEVVRDRSDVTGHGADHEFVVSVVTTAAGFAVAKTLAAVVSDALESAALPLARGRLVGLRFARASAAREGTGDIRRIDLRFIARVEDF